MKLNNKNKKNFSLETVRRLNLYLRNLKKIKNWALRSSLQIK